MVEEAAADLHLVVSYELVVGCLLGIINRNLEESNQFVHPSRDKPYQMST